MLQNASGAERLGQATYLRDVGISVAAVTGCLILDIDLDGRFVSEAENANLDRCPRGSHILSYMHGASATCHIVPADPDSSFRQHTVVRDPDDGSPGGSDILEHSSGCQANFFDRDTLQ